MYKTLYSPDGQPCSIPAVRAGDYLLQGYSATPPGVAEKPELSPVQLTGDVDINSATLKKLAALPGVTTADTRKISAERQKTPFTGLEDLIARVPEVEWVTLAHLVTCVVPEPEVTETLVTDNAVDKG